MGCWALSSAWCLLLIWVSYNSYSWPALRNAWACRFPALLPVSPVVSGSWLPQIWLQSTHRWSSCLSWQSSGGSCLWILLPWPHTDKQHTNRQGTRHFDLGTQHAPGTISRRFWFPNMKVLSEPEAQHSLPGRMLMVPQLFSERRPFPSEGHLSAMCWGERPPKESLWEIESSSQRLGLYWASTNVGDIVSLILEAKILNHIPKDEMPFP